MTTSSFQIIIPNSGGYDQPGSSSSSTSIQSKLHTLIHNSGQDQPCSSTSNLRIHDADYILDSYADNTAQDLDQDGIQSMGGVAGLGSDRDLTIACTGESIASSQTFMRGHGSYLDQETSSILSSVCGTVERVNKLVSVRPVRTRYSPEVGDLVVGRVTEVGPRRWKVDIGSKSDAALLLSSVNLPGGVQRRKLESDELQMRNFFQEGDLLVAEVQSIFHDGSVGLHTRSLRYGKLRNGSLVRLAPVLIQRLKSHFLTLPNAEVDIVLGLNGYVWVAKHIPFDVTKAEGEASGQGAGAIESGSGAKDFVNEVAGLAGKGIGMDIDGVYSDVNEEIPIHVRRSISRVSHLLKLLASYQLPISDVIVQKAYDVSVDLFGGGAHSDQTRDLQQSNGWEEDVGGEKGRLVIMSILADLGG